MAVVAPNRSTLLNIAFYFAEQRNKGNMKRPWLEYTIDEKKALYAKLSTALTPHKQSLFEEKVANRTRHLSIGLENMMKSHNASALMRTADAFGVHRVDVLDQHEQFNVSSGISKGVEKWLDLSFSNSYDQLTTKQWAAKLKSAGRRLVVTTLVPGAKPIGELDVSTPLTICFGNEQLGASKELEAAADERVYIPMYGFVESFNVSVSCGIILHHLTHKMRSEGCFTPLEEEDKWNVLIEWAMRTVPNPLEFR